METEQDKFERLGREEKDIKSIVTWLIVAALLFCLCFAILGVLLFKVVSILNEASTVLNG